MLLRSPLNNKLKIVLAIAAIILIASSIWVIKDVTKPKSINGLPNGTVSLLEVEAHPEAKLVYPGTRVVRWVGSSQMANPIEGGTNGAFYGAILTTDDSSDKVYAWYDAWLTAHGWKQRSNVPLADTESSTRGYERGARERFLISIDIPWILSETIGSPIPKANTVFDYSYSIYPH